MPSHRQSATSLGPNGKRGKHDSDRKRWQAKSNRAMWPTDPRAVNSTMALTRLLSKTNAARWHGIQVHEVDLQSALQILNWVQSFSGEREAD